MAVKFVYKILLIGLCFYFFSCSDDDVLKTTSENFIGDWDVVYVRTGYLKDSITYEKGFFFSQSMYDDNTGISYKENVTSAQDTASFHWEYDRESELLFRSHQVIFGTFVTSEIRTYDIITNSKDRIVYTHVDTFNNLVDFDYFTNTFKLTRK